jgi:hypothetical protein
MRSKALALASGLSGILLLLAIAAPAAVADDAVKNHWVGQWNKLRAQQQELSSELESSRIEYRRGRRANRVRGPERAEVLERIAALEKELAAVEIALESFPEKARKAGALPGWFREAEALEPNPASGASAQDR